MTNPCAFAEGLVELASPECRLIAADDFCDRYFFRVAAAEYADSYTVRRCVYDPDVARCTAGPDFVPCPFPPPPDAPPPDALLPPPDAPPPGWAPPASEEEQEAAANAPPPPIVDGPD